MNPFDDPFGDRIAQSTSPARRPEVAPPGAGSGPDLGGAPMLAPGAGPDAADEPSAEPVAPVEGLDHETVSKVKDAGRTRRNQS